MPVHQVQYLLDDLIIHPDALIQEGTSISGFWQPLLDPGVEVPGEEGGVEVAQVVGVRPQRPQLTDVPIKIFQMPLMAGRCIGHRPLDTGFSRR